MHHTRKTLRDQRGLYLLILALGLAWLAEPLLQALARVCADALLAGAPTFH